MIGWECPVCHAGVAPTVTICPNFHGLLVPSGKVGDQTITFVKRPEDWPQRSGSTQGVPNWDGSTVTINGEDYAVGHIINGEDQ